MSCLPVSSPQVAEHELRVSLSLVVDYTGSDNHVAASQRLPFDVLATVFAAIPATDSQTVPLDVVALVCRHWRAVALDLPYLWGEITVYAATRPHAVARWLARSKDTPLRLTILDPRDEQDILQEVFLGLPGYLATTVRMLRDHASRIERLELSRLGLHTTVDVLSVFSRVAVPRLQCLQVEPVVGEIPSPYPLDATLDMPVLGGQMQRLRKLIIAHLEFPLASYFDLKELRLIGQSHLPPLDILSLLARSPALEILEIEGPLSSISWPDDTSYPTKTVALPRLQHLRLRGGQLWALHMLAHLEFPATTLVDVTLEERALADYRKVVDEDQDEEMELEGWGVGPHRQDPVPHCRSFQAIASTIQDLTLEYGDGDGDDFFVKLSSADGSPGLQVTWRWNSYSDFTHGSIWYDLVPLPAVQRLRINCIPFARAISQVEWRLFLGLMPSLRTIEITHAVVFFEERCYGVAYDIEEGADVFKPMFLALSRPTTDPITRSIRRLPCPALRSVTFFHRSWEPLDATTQDHVSRCNRSRGKSGARRPVIVDVQPCMCAECGLDG